MGTRRAGYHGWDMVYHTRLCQVVWRAVSTRLRDSLARSWRNTLGTISETQFSGSEDPGGTRPGRAPLGSPPSGCPKAGQRGPGEPHGANQREPFDTQVLPAIGGPPPVRRTVPPASGSPQHGPGERVSGDGGGASPPTATTPGPTTDSETETPRLPQTPYDGPPPRREGLPRSGVRASSHSAAGRLRVNTTFLGNHPMRPPPRASPGPGRTEPRPFLRRQAVIGPELQTPRG